MWRLKQKRSEYPRNRERPWKNHPVAAIVVGPDKQTTGMY